MCVCREVLCREVHQRMFPVASVLTLHNLQGTTNSSALGPWAFDPVILSPFDSIAVPHGHNLASARAGTLIADTSAASSGAGATAGNATLELAHTRFLRNVVLSSAGSSSGGVVLVTGAAAGAPALRLGDAVTFEDTTALSPIARTSDAAVVYAGPPARTVLDQAAGAAVLSELYGDAPQGLFASLQDPELTQLMQACVQPAACWEQCSALYVRVADMATTCSLACCDACEPVVPHV